MKQNNNTIILNIIMPFFTQIISIIVALLVPRLLINVYGSSINGLISSTNQIISYFAIIEGGICSVVCAGLAKPLIDNNYKKINSIMTSVNHFYKKFSYILMIFTILFSIIYPIKMGNDYFISCLIIFMLCITSIIGYYYYLKYNLVLFASGRQFAIILSASFTNLLIALIQFILIKKNASILLIVMITPLLNIIRLEILKILIKRKFKYLDFETEEDKKVLGQKWDATVLVISRTLKTLIPLIFLNLMFDFKVISVFSIYITIFHVGNSIITTIGNGLVPDFSKKIASNQSIASLYKFLNVFCYSMTLLFSVCFLFLLPSFITIYVGTKTDISYNSLLLAVTFIINEAIMNIRFVPEIYIKSTGNFKSTNKSMYIELIISFILTPISCYLFGYEGVLIGSIAGSIYRTAIITKFTQNSTNIHSFNYLKNILFSFVYFLICLLIYYLLIKNVVIHGFVDWAILAIIVGIINSLFIMITQVFILNKTSIKSFLIKKK